MKMPGKVALTPELLVPKLGDYLIEHHLLLPAQLDEALAIQQQRREVGEIILLGELLIEKGILDRQTLDQAITVQIWQLRNALQDANHTLEQKVEDRTRELQIALNKLTELDKLKANFISNISHELRTPLTHIKGYQELLLGGAMGKLTSEQQETINVIKKASERLERLIDDLISITQISKGEAGLKLAPAQLQEIISDVIQKNQTRANEKNIRLSSKHEGALPEIVIDKQ